MKASVTSSTANASSVADRAPSQPNRTFRLGGPRAPFDPRVHAVRPDLADIALADRLFAPYYAEPRAACCAAGSAMMRADPDPGARGVSQLLHGEGFAVLDVARGWAWGYSTHDHYVGYIPADALGEPVRAIFVVDVPAALLFSAPDIKAPAIGTLPIGSRVAGSAEGNFVATGEGFVHLRHLRAASVLESDPAAVAERLTGMPYLWGGRGGDGIDCSGLVQLALGLCGVAAPRDSDQQRVIGREIPEGVPLVRNDLIFFPGHVGIMADGSRLIHANAFAMRVTLEPLADVVARLAPDHERPIVARRRLDP